MKTENIVVTNQGKGFSEALAVTERLGAEKGLDRKSALHLRLLAEELFGMLRSIAGDVEANYWLESEDKSFELHMKSDIKLTEEMRALFLAAASDGKNAAAKGFMGKIKVLIADLLFSAKEMLPYALINTVAAQPMGGAAGQSASVWSMAFYKNEMEKKKGENEEAAEAWDELEKSIVANIADDIKVKIAGKNVEIIVYKTFA